VVRTHRLPDGELVEAEGGDPILRFDDAQDENIALVRAKVLIDGMAQDTGVPFERVKIKAGGWGPLG
jgi:hypothetical protein